MPSRQSDDHSRATPEMLYELAHGSLRIYQEDVAAVESTQRVIHSVPRSGVLGTREDKIQSFNAAYMSALARMATPGTGAPK